MDDIREKLGEIRESQVRMEGDIKYHIKRTNLLEERLERELTPTYKAYVGAKWSVAAVIILGSIVSAILKFRGIL